MVTETLIAMSFKDLRRKIREHFALWPAPGYMTRLKKAGFNGYIWYAVLKRFNTAD